jgi:nicotinic acid mononucleotide adenylyltransferase
VALGVYPGSFNPPTVAHLAIAEAAWRQLDLERVDLAVSRVALGKEHVEHPAFADRLQVLEATVAARPWLGLAVVDAQLLVDVAQGYDVVVMGADKWAQVSDPAWYGGSEVARDKAVARLPRVAVVPRPPFPPPLIEKGRGQVLEIDGDHSTISSSAVRAGEHGWMAPEAAAFDERTGAWTDAARYERWRGGAE